MLVEGMRCLEEENDPRILRELAKLMNAEILRLQGRIKTIEEAKVKAQQQVFTMEESFHILKKKFFGKSSEKSKDRKRDRLNDDTELTLHSQNLIPPTSKKSTKKLDEEIKVYECSEKELLEASTEIEIVERSYKKVVHKRQKYKLKKEYNTAEKEILIAAEGALKLLPGSTYSIDFAVSVVTDKYCNHLPLERQARIMDSLGLEKMKTQLLWNLCRVIGEYLEPIAEKIKNEILSEKLIHSDETPWPIKARKFKA